MRAQECQAHLVGAGSINSIDHYVELGKSPTVHEPRCMDGTEGAPSKVLPIVCIAAILAVVGSYWTNAYTAWAGDDGLSFASTANASVLSVASASGPAERAGIHVGDTVDRRTLPVAVAGRLRNAITQVTVARDGRKIDFRIEPVIEASTWQDKGRYLSELWIAFFALLIAAGRKRWAHAAPLAWILGLDVLSYAIGSAALPWPPLTVAAQFIGTLGVPLTFTLLIRYFASFAAPIGRIRRLWTRLAYGTAALSLIGIIAHFAVALVGIVPYFQVGAEFEIFELLFTSPIVPSFVCGILAFRAAHGSDAQRVAWIVAAYGTFWCFWLLAGPFGFLWAPFGDQVYSTMWGIEDVSHLLVPLVFSYAALSRRLFDVGFVVNRTVVFGALSVFVVGCFVLLEWSLGKWFEDVSHTTSLALNAALALGLGLSIRVLHRRVDSVVDNVFFRKRYENERALRRFAHEAAFITDQDALLERTVTEIGDRSEASFAAVRLAGDLPANDPAVLALQAWREPVELSEYRTALEGEYLFPLLAHAEFLGAILCGEKKNGERYAPDEIEALKEVAHGVGIALWSLGVAGAGRNLSEEILARLSAIERKLSPNGHSIDAATPLRETPS